MEEQKIWSVVLSGKELYLLASMLQAKYLLDVEDPFLGFLTEEMEEQLEGARASLVQRGYAQEREGENLALDVGVATIVRIAAMARFSLAAYLSPDEHPSHFLVHLVPGAIVEQARLPSGEIALTAIRDADVLQERLNDFFALPEAPAAPGPDFTIAEADLDQARRLAREEGAEAVQSFLRGATDIPSEVIPVLTDALKEGQRMGSLVVLLRSEREVQYGDSLAWLAGRNAAWLLQPLDHGEKIALWFRPCATAEIVRQQARFVKDLLHRVEQ